MTHVQPTQQLDGAAWHAVEPEAALSRLSSSERGLSAEEAHARAARYGPNTLQARKSGGFGVILLRQVNNPIVFLLLGAAAAAVLLGKAIDGAVVFGAIVLNVAVGAIQEHKAGRAIEALSRMVPQTTRVLRDGVEVTISAAELVPGDVVLLASGDSVPADLRIVGARNLRVEEAALTGESVPVGKSVAAVPAELALGDRTSMGFSGTLVTSGVGRGLVVATGEATQLGQISHMLEEATELQTPLTRAIASVGKALTVVVIVVALTLALVAWLRGYPFADASLVAITLAVASIPEGLPAIITIALAIGVQRMATRRAIVRKLPSVETLGSTTIICSDKTGTLTRNEMTVQALATATETYAVSGVGYAPVGGLEGPEESLAHARDALRFLVEAGALCNDATLRQEGSTWKLTGDPTEGALLVAAAKLGVDIEGLRHACPRFDAIPFESEHQFMATLHELPVVGRVVLVKGAPEVVLSRTALAPALRDQAMQRVAALTRRGLRVLAVARKRVAPTTDELRLTDVEDGLELLGFEGMMDPPRPEAIAAIRTCHEAGISVKMITGDHLGTAVAIGRQLGLVGDRGQGITGAELAGLGADELRKVAADRNVFARVAPEHKLALVRALQAEGNVVAMTGDGVNDAPALKQANIGVAMGITGTAVAKEAADVVLADDNFATIAGAVEEGRRIYDNLVKSLAFVLPTNLGLGLILVTAVALFPVLEIDGAPVPLMPMLPTQMLWVNMVASVTLSLPLAFERLELDAMKRPPRSPNTPILGAFVVTRTLLVALLMCAGSVGLFWWEYWQEVPRVGHEVALREAQTMAVTTVVWFQAFYLLNCRSLRASVWSLGVFSNPAVFVGIGALLLLQAAFIYVPFMQPIFGTAPLDPGALALAAAVAAVVLPVIAVEKVLRTRRARRSPARPTEAAA